MIHVCQYCFCPVTKHHQECPYSEQKTYPESAIGRVVQAPYKGHVYPGLIVDITGDTARVCLFLPGEPGMPIVMSIRLEELAAPNNPSESDPMIGA